MSGTQADRTRRRGLGAFGPFLVGVVEVVVFVVVGNLIGFGYAILLALATSVLGLWLMRRAGFRAWRSLRNAAADAARVAEPQPRDATGVSRDASPEEKIADAGVTLLAGTVLVIPGFVSDAAALLLMLPPVRRKVGRRLAAAALRTFPARSPRRSGPYGDPDVVKGEVVEPDSISDSRKTDPTERDGM